MADDGTGSGLVVARLQVDTAGDRFRLTTLRDKYLWQTGWWKQHHRLLSSLSSQPKRAAIILSGDLHATRARDDLNLKDNPICAILTGPVGTARGWPSAVRATLPIAAIGMVHDIHSPVIEKNGFTLLDITPGEVTVRLFAWKRDEPPVAAIDSLEPYHTYSIRRS